MQDRARRWLAEKMGKRPKLGEDTRSFTMEHLKIWINEQRKRKGLGAICRTTALVSAKEECLGMTYVALRKSYYCDHHDRADVLLYRKKYLEAEAALKLQQYVWV